MNTEFKGTKGEWKVGDINEYKSWINIYNEAETCAIAEAKGYEYMNVNKDEVFANAILIADAGNTIQSCGLLPSELLKQRYELRKMLERCEARIKIMDRIGIHISLLKDLRELLESTEVNP